MSIDLLAPSCNAGAEDWKLPIALTSLPGPPHCTLQPAPGSYSITSCSSTSPTNVETTIANVCACTKEQSHLGPTLLLASAETILPLWASSTRDIAELTQDPTLPVAKDETQSISEVQLQSHGPQPCCQPRQRLPSCLEETLLTTGSCSSPSGPVPSNKALTAIEPRRSSGSHQPMSLGPQTSDLPPTKAVATSTPQENMKPMLNSDPALTPKPPGTHTLHRDTPTQAHAFKITTNFIERTEKVKK